MRSKWLALLATLALLPAGCGGAASTPAPSPENLSASSSAATPAATPAAPVELTMWMGYTAPPPEDQAFEYNSLKAIIDGFTAQHPNVHVTMEYLNKPSRVHVFDARSGAAIS